MLDRSRLYPVRQTACLRDRASGVLEASCLREGHAKEAFRVRECIISTLKGAIVEINFGGQASHRCREHSKLDEGNKHGCRLGGFEVVLEVAVTW